MGQPSSAHDASSSHSGGTVTLHCRFDQQRSVLDPGTSTSLLEACSIVQAWMTAAAATCKRNCDDHKAKHTFCGCYLWATGWYGDIAKFRLLRHSANAMPKFPSATSASSLRSLRSPQLASRMGSKGGA
eukprot:1597226-Pleurochrysis_carterae.AAC.2